MNYQKLLQRKERLEKELSATILKIEQKMYSSVDCEHLFTIINESTELPEFNTCGFTNKKEKDLYDLGFLGQEGISFSTIELDKDFGKMIALIKLELRALNLEVPENTEYNCFINQNDNQLFLIKGAKLQD